MNIYEVAKRAGVSIATVSRVINGNPRVRKETRERVEAVLREMNYTPNAIARSLVTNATQTIGVLTTDVRDSYYASAIYTIEQELRRLGYHVILCNTGMEPEKKAMYIRILMGKKVDGLIFVGSVFKERSGNNHILEAARQVPVVMLNGPLSGRNVYSIVCDDEYATTQIVDWLYQRGHRRIVYLYDVKSPSGMAKIRGFKKGLRGKGLEVKKCSLIQVPSGLEGGIEGVRRLEQAGASYTAIVTSEDEIAAGALKALLTLGKKVPEDVAVFGYNDSRIARCTTPELSSVDNRVEELAKGAARILHSVLQKQEVEPMTVVMPRLVLRGSS